MKNNSFNTRSKKGYPTLRIEVPDPYPHLNGGQIRLVRSYRYINGWLAWEVTSSSPRGQLCKGQAQRDKNT